MDEQPIIDAFNDFAAQVREQMLPVIESVVSLASEIGSAVHAAYIEDGAIYGDTQEGMLRWLKERGKIAQLRQEADYLEDYQQGLRVFKQRLKPPELAE